MKKIIDPPSRLKFPEIFCCLGLLALASSSIAATSAERVSGSSLFPQRIVQVGDQPSSEDEAQLIWQILEALGRSNFQSGLNELEQYLQARAT